jgi:3-phosphoshikimate 1-carboxyvinyltransferase
VEAKQPCLDWLIAVEKDFSAASYWVLYALINGVTVTLNGLNLPSLQGDEQILNIADQVGAEIMLYSDHTIIEGHIKRSFNIDCEPTPDLVPALSALALFCPSECVLRNVKVLEYKESNRIQALQENIECIGGNSIYDGNDLRILPQKEYHGNTIKSFHDHRIAMSFAIAGTRIPEVVIDYPECVSKSYPAFWDDFKFWKEHTV